MISRSPTTARAVIVPLVTRAVSASFAVPVTVLDVTYHWTTALSRCNFFR